MDLNLDVDEESVVELSNLVPCSVLLVDEESELVWADESARRSFDLDFDLDGDSVNLSCRTDNGSSGDDEVHLEVLETGEPKRQVRCRVAVEDDVKPAVVDAVPLEGDDGGHVALAVSEEEQRDFDEMDDLSEPHRQVYSGDRPVPSEHLERMTDAFYAVDDEYRFTYVNERAEELLQAREDELLGTSVWEQYPEAKESPAWSAFHEAMETQDPTSYEVYFEPLGFWVQAEVYPSETGLSVYFRDVGDRKDREKQLELYESIIETIDDGVYVMDEDDCFTMVNEGYTEMTGYTEDELLGEPGTKVVSDEIAGEAQELQSKLREGEQDVVKLEAPMETADGEHIVGDAKFTMIENPDGTHQRVAVVRDVTERKRREKEIKKKERRYRAIFNDPNILVGMTDTDGTVIDINDTAMEYVDASLDDIVGEPFWQSPWFQGESEIDEEEVKDWIRRAAEGDYVEFEADLRKPDGTPFTVEGAFRPVKNEDDEVVSLLISDRDVTESRRRKREIERQRHRYRVLVDNIPNGCVALFDDDLRYVVVGGRTMSDKLEPEDMEGMRVADTVSQSVGDVMLPNYSATMNGEERIFTVETDDEIREIRTVPITDEDGAVDVGMAISQDITERRQRLQELLEQREQMDVLNDVNTLVQQVSEEVLETSEEEDVFELVLDYLDSSEYYEDVWFGRPRGDNGAIEAVVRESESIGDIVDFPIDTADPGELTANAVRALEDRETYVERGLSIDVDSVETDELFDGDDISVASTPLVHGGECYGVLTLYSRRDSAFVEDEAEAIDRLGTIVGHAILSARMRSELRRSEQLYRKLAENMPDGAVTLVNEDRTIEVLEGELLDELDIDAEERIGEKPGGSDNIPAEKSRRMQDALEKALNGDHLSYDMELHDRVLEINTLPVWEEGEGEGEGESGAIALARDVTERVERKRQLEHERERLELLVRLIRHNLLNSLNVVDARIDEVEGRVDFEVAEHLETAKERTSGMINLVETIRSLTDATVRGEDDDLDVFALDDVLSREVAEAKKTYPDAEINFEDGAGVEVLADDLLGEAVENILNNAVQHNDSDTPEVEVDVETSEESAYIVVEDNGPGVPEDVKDWFLDKGTHGFQEPGTGFGLHLVREIVDSYGGEVSLSDADPEGTVVRISLPRADEPRDS